MDNLVDDLMQNGMIHIIKILIEEKYETETIEQDYDASHKNSNIRQNVKDGKEHRIIRACILNKKLHTCTFSEGFAFIDYSRRHYATLKQEMLHNKARSNCYKSSIIRSCGIMPLFRQIRIAVALSRLARSPYQNA